MLSPPDRGRTQPPHRSADSLFAFEREEDLRLPRPVILLRGFPATVGFSRCFQADSRAGSARDEKKPAVVMSKTYTALQDFYGSDGTRTRDLRRDSWAARVA